MKRNRTDIAAYILFALLAATLLELLISVGPFILLAGSSLMIYYGLKKIKTRKGKFFFYSGLIIFVLTLLTSSFFILTLFALLFYTMYVFWEKARHPHTMEVVLDEEVQTKKKTFFRNIILGDQRTGKQVFSSDNINIQTGIGSTAIHFENTVLPKGDTVVIVRGFIGRVEIFVPYDVGVQIDHSTFYGQSNVFEQSKLGFNQNLAVENKSFTDAPRRLRIYTSLVAGDIEVTYR